MNCPLCGNKIHLLDRYAADDNLYHRQCYRDFQVENNEDDHEVIGNGLVIYGELKPNMNKNIYFHPLQKYKLEKDLIQTNPDKQEMISILSCNSNDSKIYNEQPQKDNTFYTTTNYIFEDQTKTDYNVTKEKSQEKRKYIKKKTFEKYSYHKRNLKFSDIENEINIAKEHQTDQYDLELEKYNKDYNDYNILHKEEKEFLGMKQKSENELKVEKIDSENFLNIPTLINKSYIPNNDLLCDMHFNKKQSTPNFKDLLASLEFKLSFIESKGEKIQLQLWEGNYSSPEYDEVLRTWLKLVEEKDKIYYEEIALYVWIQDIKLLEMKENIEGEIRLLKNVNTCNEKHKDIEDELIVKLLEIVNKRAEIVDIMNEENLKRLETIENRQEIFKRLCDRKVKEDNIKSIRRTKKMTSFWSRKWF